MLLAVLITCFYVCQGKEAQKFEIKLWSHGEILPKYVGYQTLSFTCCPQTSDSTLVLGVSGEPLNFLVLFTFFFLELFCSM